MKTIITSILLAVIGLLCGCANLAQRFLPETDPNLINAAATAKSSDTVVKSFLAYEAANRNTADNDVKSTARGLENFDQELTDLKTLMKMYSKYRSGENLSRLATQTKAVQGARDRAATAMVGGPVERGQGAPFAPGIASPGEPPTAMDTLFERLDGIRAEQVSQRAEMALMRNNIAKVGHMVWTNQQARATNAHPHFPVTNAVPPAPAIPGK